MVTKFNQKKLLLLKRSPREQSQTVEFVSKTTQKIFSTNAEGKKEKSSLLREDPRLWKMNTTLLEMKSMASLKVVNGAAERVASLIQTFNMLLTKDGELDSIFYGSWRITVTTSLLDQEGTAES